ncbi:hypothetical protein BD779DRAFT_1519487 [Infundibulicybe gibba]|nr:hypothetical protein BD779DRAFT_1519487 [Infundibulicybe gibba]
MAIIHTYVLLVKPLIPLKTLNLVNEPLMSGAFQSAMAKMAVLGQNRASLVDCSEVIPPPTFSIPRIAHLPPGKNPSITIPPL